MGVAKREAGDAEQGEAVVDEVPVQELVDDVELCHSMGIHVVFER